MLPKQGRATVRVEGSHTIVLSKLCYRHRELGVDYVVPCQTPIGNADDLLQGNARARCGLRAEQMDL
jgi:hypothetical protein